MRSRNIKPGLFTNEDLIEVPPLGRLLFIGLWCAADREGRLEDRPKKLKLSLLPGDRCNADELLDILAEKGFIIRYEKLAIRYIAILKFRDHQNPHPNEAASIIPAPDDIASPRVKVVRTPADSLFSDSLNSVVSSVFEHWKTTMGSKSGKLTPGRALKIKARMEEGYTLENITAAIDGCRASKWHMGDNPSGRLYNDLTLICRSGEKLEDFISMKRKIRSPE